MKCNFVTKLSLWYVRFCASIIVFFKIINMRGYLWIFNWWWPYSPNPSCPLALKNDLKILTCSFCFASSFHFAIPLQPSANRPTGPPLFLGQSLWLAGPPAPRPSAESIFYFFFYSAIFYWSKNWKNGNSLTSVFLLLAVADSDFWNLRLEKKHEKKAMTDEIEYSKRNTTCRLLQTIQRRKRRKNEL